MRQPDMLDGFYAVPKESFMKRYGGRIIGGIACSAVVAIFMNLGIVKVMILWICQIVLMIFGRPHGADKIDKAEGQIHALIDKGKQVAKQHAGESHAHTIPA